MPIMDFREARVESGRRERSSIPLFRDLGKHARMYTYA